MNNKAIQTCLKALMSHLQLPGGRGTSGIRLVRSGTSGTSTQASPPYCHFDLQAGRCCWMSGDDSGCFMCYSVPTMSADWYRTVYLVRKRAGPGSLLSPALELMILHCCLRVRSLRQSLMKSKSPCTDTVHRGAAAGRLPVHQHRLCFRQGIPVPAHEHGVSHHCR